MSDFDPTTLSPDDPLRDTSVDDWIAKVRQDHPEIAANLVTNPQAAIRALADKGVGPPPMSFADPYGNSIDPTTGMPQSGPAMPPGQSGDPTASQGPYVMNKGGPTTAPSVPVLPSASGAQPPAATPIVAPPTGASLDPEENPNPVASGSVPLPTARDPASDVSGKKKADDGSGDFAKMLAGLKPIQPPALNPVGTPSVRSSTATGAPNVATLLQLLGQQSTPTPATTLGRLLVAGKA